MTISGFRVKVPGKLLVAGEYAILEPNQKAVVMAVNRYVSAYVEPSRQNQLSLPQLGLDDVTWDQDIQFNVLDSRFMFRSQSVWKWKIFRCRRRGLRYCNGKRKR